MENAFAFNLSPYEFLCLQIKAKNECGAVESVDFKKFSFDKTLACASSTNHASDFTGTRGVIEQTCGADIMADNLDETKLRENIAG